LKLQAKTDSCLEIGYPDEIRLAPANILNKLDVPVVVRVGLCIGHDMIFIRHCKSSVIPFIAKMPMTFGAL